MSGFNFKKDIEDILSKYPDNKAISVMAILSPIEWDSAVMVVPSSRYTKKGVKDLHWEMCNINGVTYADGVLILNELHESDAKEIAKYLCQYLRDIGYKTVYSEKEKQFGESVIEAFTL